MTEDQDVAAIATIESVATPAAMRTTRRRPHRTATKFTGNFQPHVARKPLQRDGSVGPGSYGSAVSTGRQSLSSRDTAPSFSFGLPRPITPKARQQVGFVQAQRELDHTIVYSYQSNPGPGSYVQTSAIGSQCLSQNCTQASVKFGAQKREAGAKAYVPGFTEKDNAGINSPGPSMYSPNYNSPKDKAPQYTLRCRYKTPKETTAVPGAGTYNAVSSMLTQPSSRLASCSNTRFGKAERDGGLLGHDRPPGPGAYDHSTSFLCELDQFSASTTLQQPPSFTFGTGNRGSRFISGDPIDD